MKKILKIFVFSLLLFCNVDAEERKDKLDTLFTQLKDTKNLSSAQAIEREIQEIWLIHMAAECLRYFIDTFLV